MVKAVADLPGPVARRCARSALPTAASRPPSTLPVSAVSTHWRLSARAAAVAATTRHASARPGPVTRSAPHEGARPGTTGVTETSAASSAGPASAAPAPAPSRPGRSTLPSPEATRSTPWPCACTRRTVSSRVSSGGATSSARPATSATPACAVSTSRWPASATARSSASACGSSSSVTTAVPTGSPSASWTACTRAPGRSGAVPAGPNRRRTSSPAVPDPGSDPSSRDVPVHRDDGVPSGGLCGGFEADLDDHRRARAQRGAVDDHGAHPVQPTVGRAVHRQHAAPAHPDVQDPGEGLPTLDGGLRRQRLEQIRRARRCEGQRQQAERRAQRRRAERAAVALDRTAGQRAGPGTGRGQRTGGRLDARAAQLGLAPPPHLPARPHLPHPGRGGRGVERGHDGALGQRVQQRAGTGEGQVRAGRCRSGRPVPS